jgi:hypothetical protein
VLARQALLEQHPESQRDVGILGGVMGGSVERHLVEGDGALARAGDFLVGDGLVAQMFLRELVHAMAVEAAFQGIGHQHRVLDRRHLDAETAEDQEIVFEILADLEDGDILQHRLQQRDDIGDGQLLDLGAGEIETVAGAMADRNVAGQARIGGERDAGDIRLHRVERGGLAVERDVALLAGCAPPSAPARPWSRRFHSRHI